MDIQTDGDNIKRVVYVPSGDHTLKKQAQKVPECVFTKLTRQLHHATNRNQKQIVLTYLDP